jgi:hypothetical protein
VNRGQVNRLAASLAEVALLWLHWQGCAVNASRLTRFIAVSTFQPVIAGPWASLVSAGWAKDHSRHQNGPVGFKAGVTASA